MKYINRTGIATPIGKIVKLDTDSRGVLLAQPADTDVLGVVTAMEGKIAVIEESGIRGVFIYNKFSKGDTVYVRKANERGRDGDCYASASPAAGCVVIGTSLESGEKRIANVKLGIYYSALAGAATGYVPYTGAISDVDLGAYDIEATDGRFDGNVRVRSDSNKVYLGAGADMTLWYDGTDGHIKTSDVGASDLVIDCGTDKTLKLGETVWDDSMVAPTAFRAGSTSLTFAALTATIWTHRWDVGDEVHIVVQFPHGMSVNTSIVPHVHIVNKNAIGASAYNVAFDFYYTWANIGQIFPSELSELNVKQSFQNADALTHKMLNFTAITPTAVQGGISSIFLARIIRVAASVEAYNTADIFTLGFDIHYQKDSLGSRQVAAK